MAAEKAELEKFLRNVEEVGSIIKNLSSKDEKKCKEAMEASEEFVKLKDNEQERQTYEQENFLDEIELDVRERSERRKKNEADAEKLKTKGNNEFKHGRYQEAIEFYSEAIQLVKYISAFYTNRAQAYIKLQNYDAAIDDCKWAMRIDTKCVKAYVHCARALQKKAHFSEAILLFKKVEEIDSKQKDVIAGYILQLENEKKRYDLERKVIAEQKNDSCLTDISEIVKTLGENTEKVQKCIVRARRLENFLKSSNTERQTLFRFVKGFDCFGKGSIFGSLCENRAHWSSVEQETFVCEMLNLAMVAIFDNEDNVAEILNRDVIDIVHQLCHESSDDKVCFASLKFLHQLTEYTEARERIVDYTERNYCFVEELFQFLEKQNAISRVVMGCINNLSLDKRFSVKHSLQLELVMLSFIRSFVLIRNDEVNKRDTKAQASCVSSSFSTMANLVRVKTIRSRVQNNNQVWRLCVDVLTRHVDDINCETICDIIYAELGLLINLLTEESTLLKNYTIPLAQFLLKLLPSESLMQRVLSVLRLLMTYSTKVVRYICSEISFESLLRIVEKSSDDVTRAYAVKCFALCTINNKDARTYISSCGLTAFHKLLSSKNEAIVGNSALILSNCFEQLEKVQFDQLAETSVVKDLLTLATKKDLTPRVKQNVAIALASLVKQDIRFLEELRELHGFEILHSVIKLDDLLC